MTLTQSGNIPPYSYLVHEFVSALPATSFVILLKHECARVKFQVLNEESHKSSKLAVSGTQNREWTGAELMRGRQWLAMMNCLGFNIYIRPVGPHVVIDDLASDFSHVAHSDGLKVSLLVETSPGSFQAWVTLSRGREPVNSELADKAQRMLTDRYDGDTGAVGCTRFGRLPGYYNRKPKHQRQDGSFPVVGIRNRGVTRVSHHTAEEAAMLLAEEPNRANYHSPHKRSAGACAINHNAADGVLPGDLLPGLIIAQGGVEKASMSPVHISEMWSGVPGKDRSTRDWHVARWLGIEGISYDDAVRVVAANSEKARERRDPLGYAERTVRRAWGLT